MTRKSAPPSARISRRSFVAGSVGVGFIAGTAPFNIVRADTGPLKVGVLLPRSGFEAGIGQDCQRGVDIAPAIFKARGLPELTILSGDTESNVDVGAFARRKADRRRRTSCWSARSIPARSSAIAQVAEQKGIPYVINIAAAPAITEQGYKFVFRNFPTAPMILRDAFTDQKTVFGLVGAAPKSVVFMHVNDTFGTAMAKGIGAIMPKFNMPYTIAEEISYDPAARDLSVEVAKAKAANADALLVVSRLNDALLLTRELVKQRWTPKQSSAWGRASTRTSTSRRWANMPTGRSASRPGTIRTSR